MDVGSTLQSTYLSGNSVLTICQQGANQHQQGLTKTPASSSHLQWNSNLQDRFRQRHHQPSRWLVLLSEVFRCSTVWQRGVSNSLCSNARVFWTKTTRKGASAFSFGGQWECLCQDSSETISRKISRKRSLIRKLILTWFLNSYLKQKKKWLQFKPIFKRLVI